MLTFTPIEFVIALSDCTGSSAQPEVLKPHGLQAFEVCWYGCTMDAKEGLEKSITYEANFWLLCKCLQINIPIFSYDGPVGSGSPDVLIHHNQLRIKDKAHSLLKTTDLRASGLLVHQLHSFMATRGGSRGSC